MDLTTRCQGLTVTAQVPGITSDWLRRIGTDRRLSLVAASVIDNTTVDQFSHWTKPLNFLTPVPSLGCLRPDWDERTQRLSDLVVVATNSLPLLNVALELILSSEFSSV